MEPVGYFTHRRAAALQRHQPAAAVLENASPALDPPLAGLRPNLQTASTGGSATSRRRWTMADSLMTITGCRRRDA